MRVSVFAPGRVNLIGEHTDYNDGLCLPCALSLGVTVRAEQVDGPELRVRALDLEQEDAFLVDAPPPSTGWRAFPRGTVAEIRAQGFDLPGAELEISGDVPRGSGLSSSAALGVALALALLALAGRRDPDLRMVARLASRVENGWVGARTGLLDQIASLYGSEGAALLLDCRTLNVRTVPLDLRGWTLAVAPSGAERSLAASGYNERRAECEQARKLLRLTSLRDATVTSSLRLPRPLDHRVRHVVEENLRVEEAVAALEDGDIPLLADLFNEGHVSLRDLYGASVPELERTRDRLLADGAIGARMMGGGFGGSVLALFPPGKELPPEAFAVTPAGGARVTVES